MTSGHLTIDGRRMEYLEGGDPGSHRLLLLVHAFGLGAHMWEPQLQAIESARLSGWRVLAPALAGHDGSDRAPDPSMDAYARQLIAVLDHAGAAHVVVAGLSMGGYIAFALLRLAANRVNRLVLADTRSTADNDETKAARLRTIELAETAGSEAVADDQLPRLVGETTKRNRPDVVARVRQFVAAQPAGGIADAARAMMTRPESTPMLASIRVPTLVIVGEEDVITTPVDSERMCAAIPGARLVRIPAAGHLSNLENPEAFNAALIGFLQENQNA